MWLPESKQLMVRAASLLLLASSIRLSTASPLSTADEIRTFNFYDLPNADLAPRCANPCGWADRFCCAADQKCFTDANNIAQCGAGPTATAQAGSGGYWQYYTSTWVETDLVTKTSVYSSYIPGLATVSATATWTPPAQATETGSAAQCNLAAHEISCGNICCTSQQYCLVSGQCAALGSGSVSESPSAPVLVTSSGVVVVTNTIQPTTTVAFQSAVSNGTSLPVTSTTSGGLSGGAIAGIVIGVLLGLVLLFLLCLCLCFTAAWEGLLAIFGLGKRRNKKTEVVEYEHYSRHGDSRRWYGDRPGRPQRPPPKKNNGIGWGGVAAGLGGLAVLLGLKRRYDRRHSSRREEEKSEYSSEYTYSEDYTVSDRTSSDGRTRDTRRSRSRR